MSTAPITIKTYNDDWSFWDSLYVGQIILDICDVVFNQIKDISILLKKSSHEVFVKLNRITTDLADFNGVIYCFGFLYSIQLIIEKKFIDKTKLLTTAANISMFVSEILTPIYWLHEKGLLHLGKCANYIGRGIEIFEGLSYFCSAISDVKTIINESWNQKRIRAIVNLVWFFLWVVGKIVENVLAPSHTVVAILTSLSFIRLTICLYDALF